MLDKVIKAYEKDYKKLLILPLSILAFFSVVIVYTKITTGEYFRKDISLKGGTSITYYTAEPIGGVDSWLRDSWGEDTQLIIISNPLGGFKGYDFRVGQELTIEEVSTGLSSLVGREVSQQEFSMGLQGASIAAEFFNESLLIISISFIFMSLVVLYYFRSFIPAVSITFSTIADVIVIIGVLNLLGKPLSVAGIGALLMIIGMSTDSDMLLAANIIKKKEKSLIDRLTSSFRTELTMTLAAITTAIIMYSLTTIDMIRSIAFILLVGSISDVINTWILSAGLQRAYMERKNK
jgi:preprotein translocase subunit SecF